MRFPFYFSGFRNSWNSLTELTITLAFPFVCYLLTVVSLLVGFLWIFLTIVAVLLVLAIVFWTKHAEVKIPDFIENNGKDCIEDNTKYDNGSLLESFVRNTDEPALPNGYRWKPYSFNVSVMDGSRIYVCGIIYCLHKDLWYPSSIFDSIRKAVLVGIRNYPAEYNGPEVYIDFGGIGFEKDPDYDAVGE